MVVVRRVENLRFVLQAAVCLAVQKSRVVALKVGADVVSVINRSFAFYGFLPLWIVFIASF